MNAVLKLVYSEGQMELYRHAELEAVEQRISNREEKLKMLRERYRLLHRQIRDEDDALGDDKYRRYMLIKRRAKPIVPPLEEAIDE